MIGSVFGVIFVVANSGSLPTPVATLLRLLAVAVAVAVLVAGLRRRPRAHSPQPSSRGFGRAYWLIVAGEVAAIAGGLALLNGPLDAPQGAVGWIAFVVGVHFLALAAAWQLGLFRWLGAALVLCGGAALALTAAGAPDSAIDVVGGVLSGAILLGFSMWGVIHRDAPYTRSHVS